MKIIKHCIGLIIKCLETYIEDHLFIQEITRIVTGFEIQYWNDSKVEDFYDDFSKIITQLNEYKVQQNLRNDEVKITINNGSEETKISQFNKTTLSGNGQIMFNKIKATIDNFGKSISYEEKMQIMAKLFSEII